MAPEFKARIRRVSLKGGGADVRVLESKPGPDGKDDWRGAVVRNARFVAEQATDASPLVGYVLIGMYGDGQTSVGFRYDPDAKNIIPRSMLPAWIAEIVRRELITAEEARDVFNTMFEWRDNPGA